MKTGKCDLCHAEVYPHELIDLLDGYRTHSVKDVCDECRVWADRLVRDLKSVAHAHVRRTMRKTLRARRKLLSGAK